MTPQEEADRKAKQRANAKAENIHVSGWIPRASAGDFKAMTKQAKEAVDLNKGK